MIRGVMEMLPLMSDSDRNSTQDGGNDPVFQLPDAGGGALIGPIDDPLGDSVMEGVGARSNPESQTDESWHDVHRDEGIEEKNTEGVAAESNDEGDMGTSGSRGRDEVGETRAPTGQEDDTVEAQMAARLDLVGRMTRASERLAGASGKRHGPISGDLLAAGRKKMLDLDALAAQNRKGRRGPAVDLNARIGDAADKTHAARADLARAASDAAALDQARRLRDGSGEPMSDVGARRGEGSTEDLAVRQRGARSVDRAERANGDRDTMALRAGDMAERVRRAGRAQARHMRQEITSTEALRASSSMGAPEAPDKRQAPDAGRDKLVAHVTREVKKTVEEMEGGKTGISRGEAGVTPLQSTLLSDGGSATAQIRSPTAPVGPAQPVETFTLDPKISEALRSLHQPEENQTILRLTDGQAGRIEVRLRLDGRDLQVRMRAEDVEGRQKMLEALPELRKELDKASLVAGRVDVAEFGHAEFDLTGQGQTFDQEGADEAGADGATDEKRTSSGRSGGPAHADTTAGPQPTNDGRLHVIV